MKFELMLSELLVSFILLALFLLEPHLNANNFLCVNLLLGFIAELLLTYSHLYKSTTTLGRASAAHGFWITCLVPMLFFLQGDLMTSINLAYASRLSFFISVSMSLDHFGNKFALLGLVLLSYPIPNFLNMTWFATFLFTTLFSLRLMKFFPASLTTGESILLSQLVFSFIISSSFFIFPFVLGYLVEHLQAPCNMLTLRILFLVFIFLWSIADFLYLFCGIAPPTFQNIWIWDLFVAKNFLLCIAWLPMCVMSVGVVFLFSTGFPILNDTSQHISSTKRSEVVSKGSENVIIMNGDVCAADDKRIQNFFALRKLFHFFSGVVYCTGILISPEFLSASSTCVLIAFLLIEWMRRRGPKQISGFLSDLLAPFRDSRDSGDLIFTPIALLLGLSLPVWGVGRPSTVYDTPEISLAFPVRPSTWAGVITVALGDSVAAIVGKYWGSKWKWPFTHRTVIGSSASLIAQLLFWSLLVRLYSWPWTWGAISLAIGVFVEAYTEQIDNLAVPLLVMMLFSVQK